MKEINILITAAGRRVQLIHSFVEALRSLGLRGNVVTSDTNTLSPGLYFSDRHYIVPPTADPHYIPTIKSICFKERIHLLVPTINDELPLFGAHAESLMDMGVRVTVSAAETGAICNDRYRSVQFLAQHEIPVPRSWLPHELEFGKLSYPLFLKPRLGHGGGGTCFIRGERELRFFLDYLPDPVVQEYLPGSEFTVDLLADFEGQVISVVPRERLLVRSGVTDRGQTRNNAAMIDQGVRIAEALRIRGPANFQLKWYEGKGTVFEVKPRLSGGIPLTIAAGANFPAWLIEMRLGHEVQPALGQFADGLIMTCYEAALLLSPSVANAGSSAQPASSVTAQAERCTGIDKPESEVRALHEKG